MMIFLWKQEEAKIFNTLKTTQNLKPLKVNTCENSYLLFLYQVNLVTKLSCVFIILIKSICQKWLSLSLKIQKDAKYAKSLFTKTKKPVKNNAYKETTA